MKKLMIALAFMPLCSWGALYQDAFVTWDYVVKDGAATILGRVDGERSPSVPTGNMIVPWTLGKIPVFGIGKGAFKNHTGISHVVVGGGVSQIGAEAFLSCKGLTSICLPNSVTSIGESAFAWCEKLERMSVACLTSGGAYNGTEGRDEIGVLNIPSSVGSIGFYAFSHCGGLTAVTIPSSVSWLGAGAFEKCEGLTSVTMLGGVTRIEKRTFADCKSLVSVKMPVSVGVIEDEAFANCKELKSIVLPARVAEIGDGAFRECVSLTSITIPPRVKSIGKGAFAGCWHLSEIVVAGDNAAYSSVDGILYDKAKNRIITCPMNKRGSVKLPPSVKNVTGLTFTKRKGITEINVDPDNKEYCSIDGILYDKAKKTLIRCPEGKCGVVKIPSGVVKIMDGAFLACRQLTLIEMPESITQIGNAAFKECLGLTSITLPPNLRRIEKDVFSVCQGLTKIELPDGVTSIGAAAFYNCIGLRSVAIPSNVTSIEDAAFNHCNSLSSVELPTGLKKIGKRAFKYCRRLEALMISGGVTSIGEEAFAECPALKVIHVSGAAGELRSRLRSSGIGADVAIRCVGFLWYVVAFVLISVAILIAIVWALARNERIRSSIRRLKGRFGSRVRSQKSVGRYQKKLRT